MRLGSHIAVAVAATALIRPLAWELPYAMGVGLKKKKKRSSSKYPGAASHFLDLISDHLETDPDWLVFRLVPTPDLGGPAPLEPQELVSP